MNIRNIFCTQRSFSLSAIVGVAFASAFLILAGGCQKEKTAAIVQGGSMVPTLRGTSLQSDCVDCGFTFLCDAIRTPKNDKLVCPNCGFRHNKVDDATTLPAERLNMVPLDGDPQRGEIVCFRQPDSEKIIVKRVIGLPGETIGIRDGRIIVDSKAIEMPTNRMAKLIHVFDSKWQPAESLELPNRLMPIVGTSGWSRVRNKYRFDPKPAHASPSVNSDAKSVKSEPLDWLAYQHWRCFAHPGKRDEVFPVEDNYGFNQTVSRTMNRIRELKVTVNLSFDDDSVVRFRFGSPSRVVVEFDFERDRVGVSPGGFENLPLKFSWLEDVQLKSTGRAEISFSTIGGTQVLSVNRRKIWRGDIKMFLFGNYREWAPVEIASRRGSLLLERLRIEREVFYYSEPVLNAFKLGGDEYFLLGDNPPISRDSRQFEPGGVKRAQFIGRIE